ncbi:DUF2628 domain-containing protein [Terrisporobacter glycolicus]|uniref:DUF2628 domain-containing protein n=1 Tax=Terrisporobacter petrolearius TaxID=1460447 RepID=UPI0011DE1A8E
MLCKNCGFDYNENSNFCPKCNRKPDIDKDDIVIINDENCHGEYYRNSKTKYNVYDEFASLKPYYQIEFTKIKDSGETYKGKFNFFPFLFSWIWMLTKKMYVGAVVYIIVVGALTNYVHGVFSLLFAILMGIRANYMYYNYYTKGTYKLW